MTRPPTTPVVLDPGSGAVSLCLGGVMESMPPQCDGLPVAGWSWEDAGGFEERSGVRWGPYSLRGTFDGDTFTVAEAIPAALYDAAAPEKVELEAPGTVYNETALDGILEEVTGLPGALSAFRDGEGRVLAEVVYDDGTLQSWADERYGGGVVVLTSALVPTAP